MAQKQAQQRPVDKELEKKKKQQAKDRRNGQLHNLNRYVKIFKDRKMVTASAFNFCFIYFRLS